MWLNELGQLAELVARAHADRVVEVALRAAARCPSDSAWTPRVIERASSSPSSEGDRVHDEEHDAHDAEREAG